MIFLGHSARSTRYYVALGHQGLPTSAGAAITNAEAVGDLRRRESCEQKPVDLSSESNGVVHR
jgi:hypothetical protein